MSGFEHHDAGYVLSPLETVDGDRASEAAQIATGRKDGCVVERMADRLAAT